MAVQDEARGLLREGPREPTLHEYPCQQQQLSADRMSHWIEATHAPLGGASRWGVAAASADYEVVFSEDRLGLTLRCQPRDGSTLAPTVVKSTSGTAQRVKEGDILVSVNGRSVVDLDFRDVRRLLKISSRPICLRFRPGITSSTSCPSELGEPDDGVSDVAFSDIATASGSSVSSRGSGETSDPGIISDLSAFSLPAQAANSIRGEDSQDDDEDLESHQAVQSESFGDADSTRTTENSSVFADLIEMDYKYARQSSLFSALLRKPFRRTDPLDTRRIETRLGAIPSSPRVEVAMESPSKAALRIHWAQLPNSISSHVQFARDRTVKVWRNWSGRVRRSGENDRLLTTTIFGLDYGKSYVVRVRFAFNGSPFLLSEWSSPSSSVVTAVPGRVRSLRVEYQQTPRP